MNDVRTKLPWILILLLFVCRGSLGSDWPSYNGDNMRSGVSAANLKLPLKPAWIYESADKPQPAWPDPAYQDFWHNHRDLRATVIYDRAFHVVAAGGMVYFGSSADDKIYALDARTGKEQWSFFTEGPVRLAPAIADGKVYAGSDDGCLYCLSAADGKLIWKFKDVEKEHRLPGNGRIISMWPIRSGIVVDDGDVFFAAGLFPVQGVYLYALDARNGQVKWRESSQRSLQGYMLASESRLYVPTGRTEPVIFSRSDGKSLGSFDSAGGAYVLLTEEILVTGPGRGPKQITLADSQTRETLASFDGLRMVVNKNLAYMQTETQITIIDRVKYVDLSRKINVLQRNANEIAAQLKKLKKDTPQFGELQESQKQVKFELEKLNQQRNECLLAKADCPYPYAMVVAGDTIFVGGENKVAALDGRDGTVLWKAAVQGRAYGLSVAGGALLVSTSEGKIYCFKNDVSGPVHVVKMTPEEPYKKDNLTELYRQAARQILQQTGIAKGYCLVLDAGHGRLAYELAKNSNLQIIAVEQDSEKVAQARAALYKAGLYGSRITFHQGALEKLGYSSYFANLIVSDAAVVSGKIPAVPVQDLYRLVRPSGGIICLGQPVGVQVGKLREAELKGYLADILTPKKTGVFECKIIKQNGLWALARRGTLPGSGSWTHQYANVSNTTSSMDMNIKKDLTLQWFGEPGPRNIADRHNRPMASLYINGYLVVPGNNVVMAVDAYNGSSLWQLKVNNALRLAVFRDCGWMALTADSLYIAEPEQCLKVNLADGQIVDRFPLPQMEGKGREWGYLAVDDDNLFGSGQKTGASRRNHSREVVMEGAYGDGPPVVVSDYLFCLNPDSGKQKWRYNNDSAIINSTITIGQDHIYFLESRNLTAQNNAGGRAQLSDLLAKPSAFLVKVDKHTGFAVWHRSVDLPFQHVAYLSYSQGVLLALGSRNVAGKTQYELRGFDAHSGRLNWENNYVYANFVNGSHGEQDQHPVIAGGIIYSRPYNFDLKTGEKGNFQLERGGHGCGTLTSSAGFIFDRGANPCMYEMTDTISPAIHLTRVSRVGCFVNMIPAGGLVLAPESSSGCTCGYSLQTSMAFLPVGALEK